MLVRLTNPEDRRHKAEVLDAVTIFLLNLNKKKKKLFLKYENNVLCKRLLIPFILKQHHISRSHNIFR